MAERAIGVHHNNLMRARILPLPTDGVRERGMRLPKATRLRFAAVVPQALNDQGEMFSVWRAMGGGWWPQRDSNPRYQLERLAS